MTEPTRSRWADTGAGYPDPAVLVLDPRFEAIRVFNAAVERLSTGCRWAEGPVWFGDHRCLVWSDIPNDRMLRWDEQSGRTTVFRSPSGFANGGTRDRQGRLVSCEHLARRVTRTEHDGTITVLADRFDGRRLNSPNDVIVAADGGVWFTDPTYGIASDYEGRRADPELPTAVYRIDPAGRVDRAVTGLVQPNGLCLSPDGTRLYLVDSGTSPGSIHIFDLAGPTTVSDDGRVFAELDGGGFDGVRCDAAGNLWAAASGGDGRNGVQVFAPDGDRIGQILLPEACANLCFGGAAGNRLFMAASRSVYSLYVNASGA